MGRSKLNCELQRESQEFCLSLRIIPGLLWVSVMNSIVLDERFKNRPNIADARPRVIGLARQ
jgi:hypothetical protein